MKTIFNKEGVSVPLRGLDIRKPHQRLELESQAYVSVPLRGLDIRKPYSQFSLKHWGGKFQSPCGD